MFTGQNPGTKDSAAALATKFLAQVNLTIPPTGKGYEWISLCQVKTRVADSGFNEKEDTQTCSHTSHGHIKEIRVKENGEIWRCTYNNELYASNTTLNYENNISNKYDAAVKLAADAKFKATVDLLQSMKSQHLQNLRVSTNKDTAKLTATAKSAPFFGGGGSCDLTLEGLVNEMF
jgi:hypothetical protein